MPRSLACTVTSAAVAAICACGGSTSSPSDAGADAAHAPATVPLQHRPSDAACLQPPPAAGCPFPGGTCTTDAQCTSPTAPNGRCIEPSENVCTCTYDACAGDTACPTGQTCACHGSPYVGASGSACIAGNCRVDSDCEGGHGYCSPSPSAQCGAGSGPGLTGYYCHTPTDVCVDDSDCPVLKNPTDPNDTTPQTCAYSPAAGHWQCQPVPICGG
jgi:hypothetical protein